MLNLERLLYALVSQNISRGCVAGWRTRATLATAAAAAGMRYGDWDAREAHACVKALIVHGAAFFRDGVSFTKAWLLCDWLEMRKAVGTREIGPGVQLRISAIYVRDIHTQLPVHPSHLVGVPGPRALLDLMLEQDLAPPTPPHRAHTHTHTHTL